MSEHPLLQMLCLLRITAGDFCYDFIASAIHPVATACSVTGKSVEQVLPSRLRRHSLRRRGRVPDL